MPWAPELFSERFKAVEFIKTYNPDIICTQDFANNVQQDVRNNLALLRDTLGYKYINYTQHYTINTPHFHEGIGIAIFSKFPIADSGKLYYPFKKKPESIIWADIQTPLGRLRLVTTHLQSMHLSRQPNFRLEPDLYEDSAVILHGNTLEKLRYFQPFHVQQANFLRNFLDTCKPPLIFTADLNSVPSSYVYYIVKGNNLQDVFLEKGRGFGRTYHSLQPALRIDYIFHTPDILPEQSSCFPTTFSDHDPVIMDFRMNR
jgi:endonuclease/exonuclease/phosphatase family metal-dependent hydrolase